MMLTDVKEMYVVYMEIGLDAKVTAEYPSTIAWI